MQQTIIGNELPPKSPYLPDKYAVFKRFLILFLLLTLVISAVSLPIYNQYQKSLQKQLLAQEEISVVSAIQMFQKEMYEQLHMLDLIVKSDALNEYLAQGTPEQKTRLENIFKNISTSFHRYDQIRLLDNAGQEQIRVNLVDQQAVLIPQHELQNKAQRYYFTATQKMPPVQLYISAMDLNIEHDVLELPHKPILRFSTALQDAQGQPAGVLVINYLAKGMLVRFRELMTQRIDQQGMLLNNQGYWLSNHERDNEWGADLNRPDHNFSQFFPNVWPIISAHQSGILETKTGIFRYESVDPLNFLDSQPAHFSMQHHPVISPESYDNTDWKLVIFLPNKVLYAHSFLHQPLGRTLLGLLVLMIACLAWLSAYLTVQKKLNYQHEQLTRAMLERQANVDTLTGISNRRHFYAQGEAELERALQQDTPLAVLMLDADRFKKVNDTYGHAIGDLVLQELANTAITALRDTDILGRIGGEEFAVLLPDTSFAQAQEMAERLRSKIAQCQVPISAHDKINFTVSIGLVMLGATDTQLTHLLQKADLALYQAKQQGRNRVVSYSEKMSN